MRATPKGLLWLVVLSVVEAAWAGDAPPPAAAPDVDALKKEAQALRERDKALRAKLEELRTKLQASGDLAKLREAEAAAEKAYDEKRKTDPTVAAAAKAYAEAQAAFAKLVQDKLAASGEAKGVLAELAGIDDRRAALEFDEALARLELEHPSSPINVQLGKDPELAKLRAEGLQAADKEARDKARKAYEDARKAKLGAMPEARKVAERIEAARKGRADLRTAEAEATKKLSALRRAIETGDDPDVKAAREKVAAAAKAVTEATNSDALKAARKARDAAREALAAKTKELLAANPDAAALAKEREELRKQIDDLDAKLRAATKK